jgi:adenine-specific DNA glycosylase
VIELEALPQKISDTDNYAWVEVSDLENHGLPTPVRKILSMLRD